MFRRAAARHSPHADVVATEVAVPHVTPFHATPAEKRALEQAAARSVKKTAEAVALAGAASPAKRKTHRNAAYTPRRAAALADLPNFRNEIAKSYFGEGLTKYRGLWKDEAKAVRKAHNARVALLRASRKTRLGHVRESYKRRVSHYNKGLKAHLAPRLSGYREIFNLRTRAPRAPKLVLVE